MKEIGKDPSRYYNLWFRKAINRFMYVEGLDY